MFRNDPLVLALTNLRWSWQQVALLFIAIFLLTKLLISGFAGTMTSASLVNDWKSDLHYAPIFAYVRALPSEVTALLDTVIAKVGQLLAFLPVRSEFGGFREESETQLIVTVPYLRDYIDMTVMLLVAGHLTLMVFQWRLFSFAPSQLVEDGTINRDAVPLREASRLMHHFERLFNHRGWVALCAVLAVASTASLAYAMANHGFYSGLAVGPVPGQWQTLAYEGWWANPQSSVFAYVTYLITLAVLFHYEYMHAVKGILVVQMLRGFVRSAQVSLKPFFILKPRHLDACGGLGEIRKGLVQVFVSALMLAVIIFALYFYLPTQARFYVAVPALLLLTLNPLYLAVPLRIVQSEMMRSKLHMRRGLYEAYLVAQRDLIDARAGFDDAKRSLEKAQLLRDQLNDIDDIPTSLFDWKPKLIFALAYLVPLIALLHQILVSR